MELKGKRIGIIGLSRTGIACTQILTKLGATVVVSDAKNADKLRAEVAQLAGLTGVVFDLGGHSDTVLNVDFLVLSPGVPTDIPILCKAQEQGIPMIAEVELSYRLSQAPFVAITGTNGKTTTTLLIGKLLEAYSHRVFVGGNIGRPLIGEVLKLTTEDLVVAEVSSFQLEKVEEFHPRIALFLNLTPDHLDRHKTMEAYLEAKKNIFKNQTVQDYIVLNADDKIVSQLASDAPSRVIWFSRRKRVIPGCYLDGEMLVCDLGDGPIEFGAINELKIRGQHNIENALAASAVAFLLGIKPEEIRSGLRSFKGQEHTLEYVLTYKGVKYYNDSKGTNPDAAIKALEAFHEPLILIAGGLNRNLDFADFIQLVVNKVKVLILIGATKEVLRDKALECGFVGKIILTHNLRKAVKIAYEFSELGDVVLLSPACASWDMFDSYAQRGHLFKEYVRKLVK